MELIVARSGMSTGAVYRYFRGKDEIIRAAVIDGTDTVLLALAPLLDDEHPPPPAQFVADLLSAIVSAAQGGETNLMHVAVHGWSHSRSDPELHTAGAGTARRLRSCYAEVARRWRRDGLLGATADPEDVAQLLLSITLGFVAQHALTDQGDPLAHGAAVAALVGA